MHSGVQKSDDEMIEESDIKTINISNSTNKYECVLLALVEDNVVNIDIDALPFGVVLPLRDILWKRRSI